MSDDQSPAFPLQAVKSSNVLAMGYDGATRRFGVQFKSGGVYHYAEVPAKVADAVLSADSAGAAVRAHLVQGGFKFAKLDNAG